MTKLWNCPPSVFEQQTVEAIDLAIRVYNEENRARNKEEKRARQKVT